MAKARIGATTLTNLLSEAESLRLLNANFSNPVKRTGATLVIAPTKGKGVDFGAIGTAYDYWLRCEIKKSNPNIFNTFLGHRHCLSRYGDSPKILKLLKKHTSAISKSSQGIPATNYALLEACLFIAKFETEYRSGYPVETFDVAPQNIEELRNIVEGTKLDLFRRKKTVLNPIFSVQGSKLAIRADGDIVVDSVLVELKTSSQMTLKNNLRQLIGYWSLNVLGGTQFDIRRLGVYYPRFNYSIDFLPSELMTSTEQNNILGYFRKRLGSNIRSS